ncbi:MAG TPA: 2Fe-2S iron-sulfur cluster-binding protein, partial [Flexilinea sp.]|nr:2Fe-2S iron-sulfur cluster-binding protein [Flexilinea sp.]
MNNEQSKIYLTIDQKRVEAKDGMTILQIAQANRIDIPTYCVVKDLTPAGACRVCLVSVTFPNGSQRLVTACDTLAIDGMRVRTDTEEVLNSRRQAAEMLLSIAPDTPSLQRLAATYGISQPSYRTPSVQEGCIQCGACVQACREKSAGVLQF